jgi:glycerol-3-phosphate O-acyltransferase
MLRRRFGKVHVNFGEALLLETFLDQQHSGWRSETVALEQRPDWLPAVIDGLGQQVMTRINTAVDINPVNLIAFVLLAVSGHSVSENELARLLDLCRALLLACPYSDWMTLTPLEGRQIIDYATAMDMVERRVMGQERLIRIDMSGAVPCSYFRNNILHAFALPGLIARALSKESVLPEACLIDACRKHYPALREQLFLRWPEQDIAAALRKTIAAMADTGLLQQENHATYRRSCDAIEEHCLTLFEQNLQPLLDTSPALRSA